MLNEGDRLVTGHRLVKFLGRGNFGEVWQATAPGNTFTALKFLNLGQSQGRKEYRAIQPLKHLRHANLLQMTAIWLLDENGEIIPDDEVMDGGPLLLETVRGTLAAVPTLPEQHRPSTLIIAMPYADKSLDHLLKEYKHKGQAGIPRDELFDYMVDAAKAIDFLNSPHHDLGQGPVAIRHCDVKPENLLLMGQSVVLCDFGVSRTILGSSTTRKTAMGGSLAYMAPECLADEVTPYSDQFSLAISYLELRTGSLPFEEDSAASVMDQRRRGQLDLSKLPKGEASVIRRATAVQPDRRFPSSLAMVEALQASTASTAPTGWFGKVALGAIVAAGIGGAIYWTINNKTFERGGEGANSSDGSLVDGNSGEGNSREVRRSPWEDHFRAANEAIDQPDLSEAQFQSAVKSLSHAIEAGLPDTQLTFRHGQSPPNPKLLPSEVGFEFYPFAYSPDHGIVATARVGDALSLAKIDVLKGEARSRPFGDGFQFDEIRSFGWLSDQMVVHAKNGARQFVEQLETTDGTRATLFEYSEQVSIDVCFSQSRRNAVILNWESMELIGLNASQTKVALTGIDVDDSPVTQLSHDGNWVAIWTPKSIFVANLTSEVGKLQRLTFSDSQSPLAAIFSLQVDEARGNGWMTLREESLDIKDSLKLVRFSLSDPLEFELLDVPAPLGVTYARLEQRQERICLSAGFESLRAKFYMDINDLGRSMDANGGLNDSNEACVCTTMDSSISPAAWSAFATRNGRLFLQKLETDMPALEVARCEGLPQQLTLNDTQLIMGFSNGRVEMFSLAACKMMYEASVKSGRIPLPAIPLKITAS